MRELLPLPGKDREAITVGDEVGFFGLAVKVATSASGEGEEGIVGIAVQVCLIFWGLILLLV